MKGRIVCLIPLLFMTGCAGLRDYKPVVDTAVPNYKLGPRSVAQDTAECTALATSPAGYMQEGAGGMMVGGAMGAGAGAALGAAMGAGVASSAGIGAVVGIPIAAWLMWEDGKKQEFAVRTCLRDRGHSVVR